MLVQNNLVNINDPVQSSFTWLFFAQLHTVHSHTWTNGCQNARLTQICWLLFNCYVLKLQKKKKKVSGQEMKNNVTTSSSLSEFRAHLTAGSRAVFAGIISSRLHCEQIRGLSTHTYTHTHTPFHSDSPIPPVSWPHQHVSNPTVASGSSGEARAT